MPCQISRSTLCAGRDLHFVRVEDEVFLRCSKRLWIVLFLISPWCPHKDCRVHLHPFQHSSFTASYFDVEVFACLRQTHRPKCRRDSKINQYWKSICQTGWKLRFLKLNFVSRDMINDFGPFCIKSVASYLSIVFLHSRTLTPGKTEVCLISLN